MAIWDTHTIPARRVHVLARISQSNADLHDAEHDQEPCLYRDVYVMDTVWADENQLGLEKQKHFIYQVESTIDSGKDLAENGKAWRSHQPIPSPPVATTKGLLEGSSYGSEGLTRGLEHRSRIRCRRRHHRQAGYSRHPLWDMN